MKLDAKLLRKSALALLLLSSVAAAVWLGLHDEDEGTDAPPVRKPERPTRTQESPVRLQLQTLKRASQATESSDSAFTLQSWLPPVALAPAASAVAPSAPPLPFVYAGKMVNGNVITVFLQRGDESLMVSRGDTLQGAYFVEEVQPTALVLTYLPLNQRQVLSIGEAN